MMDFLYKLFPWVTETENGFLKDTGIWTLIVMVLRFVINRKGSDVVVGETTTEL